MPEDLALRQAVSLLGELVLKDGLSNTFRSKAAELTATFEADEVLEVRHLFHAPPPEPESFDVSQHGLGGWLSACQFAAFELVFNLGADALPLLRELAWGEYDWTQGNAIELLIRLAAKGVEREEILQEIRTNYPDIRYEAQIYALQPLLAAYGQDPQATEVIDALRARCLAFDETCRELFGQV